MNPCTQPTSTGAAHKASSAPGRPAKEAAGVRAAVKVVEETMVAMAAVVKKEAAVVKAEAVKAEAEAAAKERLSSAAALRPA